MDENPSTPAAAMSVPKVKKVTTIVEMTGVHFGRRATQIWEFIRPKEVAVEVDRAMLSEFPVHYLQVDADIANISVHVRHFKEALRREQVEGTDEKHVLAIIEAQMLTAGVRPFSMEEQRLMAQSVVNALQNRGFEITKVRDW